MKEQISNFDNQGTTFENGDIIDLQRAQEGILTYDELQDRRNEQAAQMRRDAFERQALGLTAKVEHRPVAPHEEIGEISAGIIRFRRDFDRAA